MCCVQDEAAFCARLAKDLQSLSLAVGCEDMARSIGQQAQTGTALGLIHHLFAARFMDWYAGRKEGKEQSFLCVLLLGQFQSSHGVLNLNSRAQASSHPTKLSRAALSPDWASWTSLSELQPSTRIKASGYGFAEVPQSFQLPATSCLVGSEFEAVICSTDLTSANMAV